MSLTWPNVRKKDIGEFMQKTAVLLDVGYDSCSAVAMLATPGQKKKDKSTDGIRRVATLLLPSLREGTTLHEAMKKHNCFREYVPQIQVGEKSGTTGEVLLRISEQIKNADNLMTKLKGTFAYPIFTLAIAIIATAYLFTNVIPDMLTSFLDFGGMELPKSTMLVLAFGDWIELHGAKVVTIFVAVLVVWLLYSRTVGRVTNAHIHIKLPLIGRLLVNISLGTFYRNWQQMLIAGAEMSIAMKTAAESVPNLYLRGLLRKAREDYADNGIPVQDALREIPVISEIELQTIYVAIEGNKLARTLGILSEDREFEVNNSINIIMSAMNPIMTIIVGVIVGFVVMAVYEPVINFSSVLN